MVEDKKKAGIANTMCRRIGVVCKFVSRRVAAVCERRYDALRETAQSSS